MKAKHNIKFEMYNAVQTVLNDHRDIVSGVQKVEEFTDRFCENNDEFRKLKEEYEFDMASLKNLKAEARKKLIDSAVPVLNVILAYAFEREEKDLTKKLNFSRNKLAKSKDLDLIEKCKIIYSTAEKLLKKSIQDTERVDSKLIDNPSDITSYGLSKVFLNVLEDSEKLFIEAHLNLRDAIEAKSKRGKDIAHLVKTNDRLLRDKLDLLVTIFESSYPEFYDTYQKTRIVAQKNDKPKKEKKKEPGDNE